MSRVSICIPTYNGEQHLRACLDSVLSQTHGDFEVIVVDDQSTDATWPILNEYSTLDSRIRLFRNERNRGLVRNWNRCIELASADWVKFVFQDDLMAPICLERMLQADAESGLPFLVCDRELIFEHGIGHETRLMYESNPMFVKYYPNGGMVDSRHFIATVLDNIGGNFVGEPTSTLFRRDIWKALGPFNAGLIQLVDLEYWVRVGSNFGVHFLSERIVRFRVHPNSTSESNRSGLTYYTSLDHVKILYDYIFHPNYKKLRNVALLCGFANSLFDKLITRARGTRWLAIDSANRNRFPDSTMLSHWQSVLVDYPALCLLLDKPLHAGILRLGYFARCFIN